MSTHVTGRKAAAVTASIALASTARPQVIMDLLRLGGRIDGVAQPLRNPAHRPPGHIQRNHGSGDPPEHAPEADVRSLGGSFASPATGWLAQRPVCRKGRWGRSYNLHLPARISLHALLNFLREVSKKTILVVANRSCKRQIRLRSDLSGSHLLPSEYKDVYYKTDLLPLRG